MVVVKRTEIKTLNLSVAPYFHYQLSFIYIFTFNNNISFPANHTLWGLNLREPLPPDCLASPNPLLSGLQKSQKFKRMEAPHG